MPRYANRAFTLIELLVVVAIIGVMIAMLAPHHHDHDRKDIMCLNNLRQVGFGYMLWASDHQDKLPWQVSTNLSGSRELIPNSIAADHFLILSNYLKQPRVFWCPTDKARSPAETFSGFSNTNLSYFNSLATFTFTNVPRIVLGGDRHLQLREKPVRPGLLSMTNAASCGWTRELHSQLSPATGRLLFADGHAETVETKELPAVFQRQPFVTNQFVIP